MRVGDRICLRDSTDIPSTTHGDKDSDDAIQVRTFQVVETQTVLDILWQDGTKTELSSTEIIPYMNPDEYDCW